MDLELLRTVRREKFQLVLNLLDTRDGVESIFITALARVSWGDVTLFNLPDNFLTEDGCVLLDVARHAALQRELKDDLLHLEYPGQPGQPPVTLSIPIGLIFQIAALDDAQNILYAEEIPLLMPEDILPPEYADVSYDPTLDAPLPPTRQKPALSIVK